MIAVTYFHSIGYFVHTVPKTMYEVPFYNRNVGRPGAAGGGGAVDVVDVVPNALSRCGSCICAPPSCNVRVVSFHIVCVRV
jgi:hypothetical protein